MKKRLKSFKQLGKIYEDLSRNGIDSILLVPDKQYKKNKEWSIHVIAKGLSKYLTFEKKLPEGATVEFVEVFKKKDLKKEEE